MIPKSFLSQVVSTFTFYYSFKNGAPFCTVQVVNKDEDDGGKKVSTQDLVERTSMISFLLGLVEHDNVCAGGNTRAHSVIIV
jgi:hypothetical protein